MAWPVPAAGKVTSLQTSRSSDRVHLNQPYYYLGRAIWFTRIGHAMAEAMKELLAGP
jgi:hypothetical protein